MELRNLIPALRKDDVPEEEREDLDKLGRAPKDEWYPLSAANRFHRVQRRLAKSRQRKLNRRYRLGVRRAEMARQTAVAQDRVLAGEVGNEHMRTNVLVSAARQGHEGAQAELGWILTEEDVA